MDEYNYRKRINLVEKKVSLKVSKQFTHVKDIFWRLGGDKSQTLWQLSCLPLIDGFYLAALSTGIFRDISQSIVFGVTAFSGAGCIVATLQLDGAIISRLFSICRVYVIVGLGAVLMSLAEPLLKALVPNNIQMLTAAFLITLGLDFSGIKPLERIARFINVTALIRAMLILIFINCLAADLKWDFRFELDLLKNIGIAVVSGWALSSMGVLLGVVIENVKDFDKRALKLGQGVSLVLMGTKVLGYQIPGLAIVCPLAAGIIFGFGKAVIVNSMFGREFIRKPKIMSN